MSTIFLIAIIIPIFTFNIIGKGRPSYGIQLIEEDKKNGKLTYEESLIQKFHYGFDKSQLDEKYLIANDLPTKCGTDIIRDYYESKNLLSEQTISIIENYLSPERKRALNSFTYISKSGNFELTYELTGDDAVSVEDLDSTGVPDYVERIASYFDYTWEFLIDTLGYLAPPIGQEKYQIYFESMGYYGYTSYPYLSSDSLTTITMNSSYEGFPQNTDPEGYEIGAAKVTAIHEFMHAIQMVYNNWNEPSWFLEMNATWVEDIGYDNVNDYYNYLNWGSDIVEPSHSFQNSSGYSDCIFMHYLSQKYSVNIIRDIWHALQQNPDLDIEHVIGAVLYQYGTTIENVMPEYYSWCYLSGENWDSRLPSFEEAPFYSTSKVGEDFSTLPYTFCEMDPEALSAEFLRFTNDGSEGYLGIDFESISDENELVLITYFTDNNASVDYYSELDTLSIDTERAIEEISSFIVIPVATNTVSGSPFTIKVGEFVEAIFEHTPIAHTEDISNKNVLVNVLSKTSSLEYDSLKLHVSISEGDFIPQYLNEIGNDNKYVGQIKDIQNGSTIRYYFSIYDSLRHTYNYYPQNAPNFTFNFNCGLDTTNPSIEHNEITSLTNYDFPIKLFAEISDNYEFVTSHVEYSINDGTLIKLPFVELNDSLLFVEFFEDSVSFTENDSIKYRIVASDTSINRNKSYYPENGYQKIDIKKGNKYKCTSSSTGYFDFQDTIIVEDDFEIDDLNVIFNSELINLSEINLSLKSPSGTTVELLNRDLFYGNSDSKKMLSIIFNQEATLKLDKFLDVDSQLVTGHYKPNSNPNENLNDFNGEFSKGEWILSAQMNYSPLYIEQWGLIISNKTNMVSVGKEKQEIPNSYELSQNYPNPFNPNTLISYSIPLNNNETLITTLVVFNILGQEVVTIVNEQQSAGNYEVMFDASNLTSGVYLYKLQSGNYIKTKKMLLLK